jgi:hypothetical protein
MKCHVAPSYWSTSTGWAPPPYWPDMWAPPTCHVAGRGRATSALSATWQHSSNTPQQAKQHLSDKWQLAIGTTKQFKFYGTRLNYLQKGPICQVYGCIAHTSKHAPSLHTVAVRNSNQKDRRTCTWSMHRSPLTAPCLMRWLTHIRRTRGWASLVPFSSSSLPLSSTRLRGCHEWEVVIHDVLLQFFFTRASKHYYDVI